MAARFYIQGPGASNADISPAYDASWDVTTDALRRSMSTTLGSTTLSQVNVTDAGNSADQDLLIVQAIAAAFGNAGTMPPQTVRITCRGSEVIGSNELFFTTLGKIVSSDGSAVVASLWSLTRDDVELSTINTRACVATITTATPYSATDRLVVEVGVGGDPTGVSTHQWSAQYGETSAFSPVDCPYSDSDGGGANPVFRPWIEFEALGAAPGGSSGDRTAGEERLSYGYGYGR